MREEISFEMAFFVFWKGGLTRKDGYGIVKNKDTTLVPGIIKLGTTVDIRRKYQTL